MIFGKGKHVKSCHNSNTNNTVHMIDYSYYRKNFPICIESIGKNDAKYYTVEQAEEVWSNLLAIGYEEF